MVPSFSSSHRSEVYNPKTFILHAALLGQSFLHCPIFLTAASRRSLVRSQYQCGRSSSQIGYSSSTWWAVTLTNYLMRRKPIYYRISPFTPKRCLSVVICGISSRFQLLSPCNSQIAHALLTRPPLTNCQHQGFLALFQNLLKHLIQPEGKINLSLSQRLIFPWSLSFCSQETLVLTTCSFDLHV